MTSSAGTQSLARGFESAVIPVANSSPLIILGRIDHLNLLRRLVGTIHASEMPSEMGDRKLCLMTTIWRWWKKTNSASSGEGKGIRVGFAGE